MFEAITIKTAFHKKLSINQECQDIRSNPTKDRELDIREKLESLTLGEIVSLEKSNKNVNGLHPTSQSQFSICNRHNGHDKKKKDDKDENKLEIKKQLPWVLKPSAGGVVELRPWFPEDAPYRPTFEVLTKDVFNGPVICKTMVDQFPTPDEMVRVEALSKDQLTAKMSVLHCMMMSHGGELLARYGGLHQSHHEYVQSANSRLKGYEERVAGVSGLEIQSKAKGKKRKKKIKPLTKILDNLHVEEDHLSTALNQTTVLEAKKDEDILYLKSTFSGFSSFFSGLFQDLVQKFLASDEFNRVQGELLSLATSAGFERGLSMHQTKDEFAVVFKKMDNFMHGFLIHDLGRSRKLKLRAKIICFEKIVQILLSNEEILEVHGERYDGNPKQLKNMKVDEKKHEDIPVVHNFPSVLLEDLSGLPLSRNVEFHIDLIHKAMPVAILPYHLAPTKIQELSNQLKVIQDKGIVSPDHPKDRSSLDASTKLIWAKLNKCSRDTDLSKEKLGLESSPEFRRSWCLEGHVRSEVISFVLA
nr:hypothetical protein [Tanacetum cinerariifolium]